MGKIAEYGLLCEYHRQGSTNMPKANIHGINLYYQVQGESGGWLAAHQFCEHIIPPGDPSYVGVSRSSLLRLSLICPCVRVQTDSSSTLRKGEQSWMQRM
jgi:hypothetical protein